MYKPVLYFDRMYHFHVKSNWPCMFPILYCYDYKIYGGMKKSQQSVGTTYLVVMPSCNSCLRCMKIAWNQVYLLLLSISNILSLCLRRYVTYLYWYRQHSSAITALNQFYSKAALFLEINGYTVSQKTVLGQGWIQMNPNISESTFWNNLFLHHNLI